MKKVIALLLVIILVVSTLAISIADNTPGVTGVVAGAVAMFSCKHPGCNGTVSYSYDNWGDTYLQGGKAVYRNGRYEYVYVHDRLVTRTCNQGHVDRYWETEVVKTNYTN